MKEKIKAGETVTFLGSPHYRVYGEVIKVNRVNMVIREDLGEFYKHWNVYKNYVRREK
jgi:Cu2+-containing amine oxidase